MRRTLLVLVLLSPWLVAVWVGLHNLRQPRPLQLLTGTTPALPIGGWLLLSSSLGATLGATAVGVLLRTERSPRRRHWSQASHKENAHDEDDRIAGEDPDLDSGYWGDAESGPGELPPIMDVPFRVMRAAQTPDHTHDSSPSPADNDDWQSPRSEDW